MDSHGIALELPSARHRGLAVAIGAVTWFWVLHRLREDGRRMFLGEHGLDDSAPIDVHHTH